MFGGIYRPVWLESVPAHSIDHVAIDARADGALTADVTLGALRDQTRPEGPTLVPELLEAQIFDADNRPVGAAFSAPIPAGRFPDETAGRSTVTSGADANGA